MKNVTLWQLEVIRASNLAQRCPTARQNLSNTTTIQRCSISLDANWLNHQFTCLGMAGKTNSESELLFRSIQFCLFIERRRAFGMCLAMWKQESNHVGNKFSFTNRIRMAEKLPFSLKWARKDVLNLPEIDFECCWCQYVICTNENLMKFLGYFQPYPLWSQNKQKLCCFNFISCFTSNLVVALESSLFTLKSWPFSLFPDEQYFMWTLQPATSLILRYKHTSQTADQTEDHSEISATVDRRLHIQLRWATAIVDPAYSSWNWLIHASALNKCLWKHDKPGHHSCYRIGKHKLSNTITI